MAFRVSRATALRVETDRVEQIILVPRFWRRVWTTESLLEELHGIGLNYTLEELSRINDELHERGVVEDVA
jgi:hypothetical protein